MIAIMAKCADSHFHWWDLTWVEPLCVIVKYSQNFTHGSGRKLYTSTSTWRQFYENGTGCRSDNGSPKRRHRWSASAFTVRRHLTWQRSVYRRHSSQAVSASDLMVATNSTYHEPAQACIETASFCQRSFCVEQPASRLALTRPDISEDLFRKRLKMFLFHIAYWLCVCCLGEFSA